jgi:hypothetical protein
MAKIAPPKPGEHWELLFVWIGNGTGRTGRSGAFLLDGREQIPTHLSDVHHVDDGGRVADSRQL